MASPAHPIECAPYIMYWVSHGVFTPLGISIFVVVVFVYENHMKTSLTHLHEEGCNWVVPPV